MYKDLIVRLRSTESRSKRALLDEAAEAIEQLMVEMPVQCKHCLYGERCNTESEWYDCLHDDGLVGPCKGEHYCPHGERRD